MKKILLIAFSLIISTSAIAQQTCKGGVVITGTINGHEYCMSTPTMTWWAAFAWCQKQGRQLASLQQACDWQNQEGEDGCENMKETTNNPFVKKGQAWTANPTDSVSGPSGVVVVVGSGTYATNNYGRASSAPALCF